MKQTGEMDREGKKKREVEYYLQLDIEMNRFKERTVGFRSIFYLFFKKQNITGVC